MHQPSTQHFTAVKRILRYIKRTISHGLFYTPSALRLYAFTNTDWARDVTDRKSTSGFCIFLGSNQISWSAKKQPTVAVSSTESEYRALAHTATEISLLKMLLHYLNLPPQALPLIWCDNIFAISHVKSSFSRSHKAYTSGLSLHS